ncbi:hypothetical protein [uncultured Serinicoccus sp.]|uniref:hypothetical protein n=1 Tax=uncultured Serinicoccus sp. TaxID=735514 RepID=UPI002619D237|nr:hypothetical protein [uncultured Serinicoccus sp.]
MSNTLVRLASLVAAGMLTLTGCSDAPGDGSTTPAPTPAAPTTSEPDPTTGAPADDVQTTTAPPELLAEEQDQADVEETLLAYSDALDRARIGEDSIEGIYPFSRDTAREQWVTQLMAYEAQGITLTGMSKLQVLEISVDGGTAEATACVDVSQVNAVDAKGDSVISEERLDRTLKDFLLERDDSAEVGWYVVEDTNRNEPCDG